VTRWVTQKLWPAIKHVSRAAYYVAMAQKSFTASRIKILEDQVKKLTEELDKAYIYNVALREENESVWFLLKELMESEQFTQDLQGRLEEIINERKYTIALGEKERGTA